MLKTVVYKYSEVPDKYWDFVHSYGTIFQSKPYLDCLAAVGKPLIVVAAFEGEDIVGGTTIKTGHRILNLIRLTNVIYFGPVVRNSERAADVLVSIADAIGKMSATITVTALPEHAEILAKDPRFSKWHKREVEFLHWDISDELESLWKGLPKRKRKDVRHAQREGVIIQPIETKQQIQQFYDLYSRSMARGGLKPEPLFLHEKMFEILRPKGLLAGFLALHPDTQQPIAAKVLLLGMDKRANFLSTGLDYRNRKLRAPDFLQWHCVEFLKSKGFTLADLAFLPKGDSAKARGIRDFKLSWTGANGLRLPSYVLTRSNYGFNPKSILDVSSYVKQLAKSASKFLSRGD